MHIKIIHKFKRWVFPLFIINNLIFIPLILSLTFHIPKGLILLEFLNRKFKITKVFPKKTFQIILYFLGLLYLYSFFIGFYKTFTTVNNKQQAAVYLMILITLIYIYVFQFIYSKIVYKTSIYKSFKKIRIPMYSIALLISIFTYGIAPFLSIKILEAHIEYWNNALTTFIIFDVIIDLIMNKYYENQNE